MKKLLSAILLTIVIFNGCAQPESYDETARKCTAAFQDGLSTIPPDSIDNVMIKREGNLTKCFTGLKFPDFNLTSTDGTKYKLSDLRGKVVMLNFWFIGCAPCVAEMPLLNELTEEYKGQNFQLLTFSTDDKESIVNFKLKHALNLVVFEKSKSLIENYFHLSYVYPTNIFIDKEGNIVEFKIGGALEDGKLQLTKTQFKQIIDRELKK
jgi:peroxiredoxin